MVIMSSLASESDVTTSHLSNFYFVHGNKEAALLRDIDHVLNSPKPRDKIVGEIINIWNFGVPPPQVELETLKAAFQFQYQDQGGLEHLQYFIENDLIRNFNENSFQYYALISSMVQSSGYGKSRALLELGKDNINVVYACVRSEGFTGFPPGNPDVLGHLKKCRNQLDVDLFVAATYVVAEDIALKDLGKDSEVRFPLKQFSSDFFTNFWARVLAINQEVSKSNEMIQDYIDHFKRIQNTFSYPDLYVKKRNGFIINDNIRMLSELVIVFDEASALLMDSDDSNIYRMLRRTQNRLGSKNCILMFVDTLSTVSSFAPPSVFDPSLRPTQGQELLPMFYELQTYHMPEHGMHDLVRKYSYGRPLWWTTFFRDGTPKLLKEAFKFACLNHVLVKTRARRRSASSSDVPQVWNSWNHGSHYGFSPDVKLYGHGDIHWPRHASHGSHVSTRANSC